MWIAYATPIICKKCSSLSMNDSEKKTCPYLELEFNLRLLIKFYMESLNRIEIPITPFNKIRDGQKN